MLLLLLSNLISINHLSTQPWDKFVFGLKKNTANPGCLGFVLQFVNK